MSKHRPSYKAAVEAKCRECIVDPSLGDTWRKQVEDCTSPCCPLYQVRPVTTKTVKQEGKNSDAEVSG